MQKSGAKIIIIVVTLLILGFGGYDLYRHRHFEEEIVAGPGVTEVKSLGDWYAPLKGTVSDSTVFILEGENPGGTVLFIGGSHPCEIAGVMAAIVIVENAVVDEGKVIVIPHANRSGSTGTQPGGGWVLYYHFQDQAGNTRKFRMGDRNAHPLDSWPDPEIFTHYPTGQKLSYVEGRNINRCWPGRNDANSFLMERVTYAMMELMREEDVDIFFDMHEAETLYPVTNCIVAPGVDGNQSLVYATMASINLGYLFDIHTEPSPANYHGFSHREAGDINYGIPGLYTFLLEAPQPYLDQPTGPKTEALLLDGYDEFIQDLSEREKLYVDYDISEGKTMNLRVGRHLQTTFAIFDEYAFANYDKPITYTAPGYEEIMENGLEAYLLDPDENPGRVYSDWKGRLIR